LSRSQRFGCGIKREVAGLVAAGEKCDASALYKLNVVKRPAHFDVQRAN
jgi:hypothetical protein